MTRVSIQDLRRARGRPWFHRHGLSWQDFLVHGIAADRLRATGDALVEPEIAAAMARADAQADQPITHEEASDGP